MRNDAALALSQLQAKEAIPELIACLKNETESDDGFIIAVVFALGELGAKDAIPELTRIVNIHFEKTIGTIATGVLASLGEKVDVDATGLTELLSYRKSWLNRVQTCELLTRLKITAAIPKISKLLTNVDWQVREAAKAALKQLQEK